MQEHKMAVSLHDRYIFCLSCFHSIHAVFPEEYLGRNCQEIPYEDYNHSKDTRKRDYCNKEDACEICHLYITLPEFDIIEFYENKYGKDYVHKDKESALTREDIINGK